MWNFIALGSYWTAAIAIQHIAKELAAWTSEGQEDQPRLSRQPLRQGADPALEARASSTASPSGRPVTPRCGQKSQWLAIRQDKPDYVLLWG
jgi:branched-chain amino acid transport system substrate-binding protein